jgi:hypothetical protein
MEIHQTMIDKAIKADIIVDMSTTDMALYEAVV